MSPRYLRHRSHTSGTPNFWFVLSTGLDLYTNALKLGLNEVLDEMNEGLGYGRNSMAIQKWMSGNTLPRPAEVEFLAKKIISHTNLDRGWVQILFNAAGYEMPVYFKDASSINADRRLISGANSNKVSSTKADAKISSYEGQTASIFISYARVDLAVAKDIYKALVRNRHDPWIDIYSIRGGEDWLRAIYRGIDECEIFLAVLSNNSVSRRGVIQKELKQALGKWEGMLPDDIYIIPVRIDDCPIPELLKHIQVLDWNNGKGWDKLLQAINIGLAKRNRP